MTLRTLLFVSIVACSSKHAPSGAADDVGFGGSTTATIEDPCFAGRGADRRRCAVYAEPNAWAFDARCLDTETHGPLSTGWPYVVAGDGTRSPRPDFIAGCVSANPMIGERGPTIICCP